MRRRFTVKPNSIVTGCPACGNNTEFWINAERVAEDCCEVWVTCKCGHDPHGSGDRLEDVWGDTDSATCQVALDCWNDAIAAAQQTRDNVCYVKPREEGQMLNNGSMAFLCYCEAVEAVLMSEHSMSEDDANALMERNESLLVRLEYQAKTAAEAAQQLADLNQSQRD